MCSPWHTVVIDSMGGVRKFLIPPAHDNTHEHCKVKAQHLSSSKYHAGQQKGKEQRGYLACGLHTFPNGGNSLPAH